jgi:hypothetical protein
VRSQYTLFDSDRNSNLYIGLDVADPAGQLLGLVHTINSLLADFKLPAFHSSPKFHISVASYIPHRALESHDPVDVETSIDLKPVNEGATVFTAQTTSADRNVAPEYILTENELQKRGFSFLDDDDPGSSGDSDDDECLLHVLSVNCVFFSVGHRLFRVGLKGSGPVEEITTRNRKQKKR